MSHQIIYSRARQTSSRTVRNTNRYCYCNQLSISNPTCRCLKTLNSTNKTSALHPSRDNLRTARLDKFQTKYDHDKEVFKTKEEEKRRKKLEDKLKRYQGVGELGNTMVDSNLTMEEKNDGYWNSRNSFNLQYQNDSCRFQQEQEANLTIDKEEVKKRKQLEEKLKRYPGIGELGNKMVDSYVTREEKNDGFVKSRNNFQLQYQHGSNQFLPEKFDREEKEEQESLKQMTLDKFPADVSNGRHLGDNSESRVAPPSSCIMLNSANNNYDNNAVASSSTSHGKKYTSSGFRVVSPGALRESSALLSNLTNNRPITDSQEPDMNAAVSTNALIQEFPKVAPSGNERLTSMNRASKEHPLLLQLTKNKQISSDNLKTNNSVVKLSTPDGSVVKSYVGNDHKMVDSSYGKKTDNSSGKKPKSSSVYNVTSLAASDSNCNAVTKVTHLNTSSGKKPKGSSVFSVTSSGILNDKKLDSSIPTSSSLDASHENSNAIIKVAPLDSVSKKKLRGSSVFTMASSNVFDDKSNDVNQVTPSDTSSGKSSSLFNVTSLAASDSNFNAVIKVAPSNTSSGKKPKGSSVFSVTSLGTLNDKEPGSSIASPLGASQGTSNAIIKVAPSNTTSGNKPKGSSVFTVASRDASYGKNLNGNAAVKDISLGTSNLTLSDTSEGCRLGGNLINQVRGEHPLLAKLTNNTLLS